MKTEKISPTIGAEVLEMDRDRLLHDPELPGAVHDALEEHGVLVFRQVGLEDEELVAFGRRLGDLVTRPGKRIPEITEITQDPGNPLAEYLRGNTQWHIDGAQDEIPCKAGILSAKVITAEDGGTEFASTYAAYDDLTDAEKQQVEGLLVMHALESTLRSVYPNPTPEQKADWHRQGTPREHPLVWNHVSGRKSLVFGSSADYVIGMDVDEGRKLLADLLERGTRPERVLRHDWSVGDMVIWDNRGAVHRSSKYESRSPRELHRVTVAGDEPIR